MRRWLLSNEWVKSVYTCDEKNQKFKCFDEWMYEWMNFSEREGVYICAIKKFQWSKTLTWIKEWMNE